MNLDIDAVVALVEKLAPGSGAPLTDDDRSLVRAALAQLGAAQEEVLALRRLLALHRESGARLDAALAESLGAAVAHGALPSPGAGYDFEGAARLRRELVESVHNAETAQEVVAAALFFARDLLVLLGK